MRRLLLLGALLLVRPGPAAADSWPAAFARTATRELQALRAAVTPADWLAGHAGEGVERFTGERPDPEAGPDHWCARARRRIAQDGGSLVRTAYFYVPEKPSSGALPDDGEASNLVMAHCQLGLVRVSGAVADGGVGRATALATRDALAALYGTPPTAGTSGLSGSGLIFGSAWFDTISHWRIGAQHALSAYRPADGSPEVIAVAALPISGMAAEPVIHGIADDPPVTDDALIDTAAIAGGIPRSSTKPILAALRWMRHALRVPAGTDPPSTPPDVVAVLERWLAAVPPGNPRARAGALLVADILVARAFEDDTINSSVASPAGRTRLAVCGARFKPPAYDGSPSYSGNWRGEAWALDDGGPVGDLALPLLLNPCDCPGGDECFRWTIREGERFLARPHDRLVEAAVHLTVAHASGYPLAVSEGVPRRDVDGSPLNLDGYRAKAIAHYRAAFARLGPARPSDDDWADAWRLLAGLPPLAVFQCGC